MDISSKKIFKTLNPNKIWIPVLIGVAIVFYLFYSDPDLTAADLKLIFKAAPLPILLAILVILARDVGYVYRIKTLTHHELSWTSSIYVIILWEFASALTPSVVGGTSVVVLVLMKEGISFGKSLAYVMLTAILDNLFFVLASPIALIFSQEELFPNSKNLQAELGNSLPVLFIISYILITVYTFAMFYALFIRPRGFKWLLLKISSLGFLRRWRLAANQQGDEIILASQELRGMPTGYWINIGVATLFIWIARYAILNCLIEAFTDLSWMNHLLVFARHLMMWIVMLISPTPGSSGSAEFFFPHFFSEFLNEYTFVTNISWRLLTYYFYLLLGAIFLPRWIKRVFFKKTTKVAES
jgi:glycosyltransferase 2 family protein